MEIGHDGLEKHDDVISLGNFFVRSAAVLNGGSTELEGDLMVCLYVTEAVEVDMIVRCTASQSCTMAVSKANCGFDAGHVS